MKVWANSLPSIVCLAVLKYGRRCQTCEVAFTGYGIMKLILTSLIFYKYQEVYTAPFFVDIEVQLNMEKFSDSDIYCTAFSNSASTVNMLN